MLRPRLMPAYAQEEEDELNEDDWEAVEEYTADNLEFSHVNLDLQLLEEGPILETVRAAAMTMERSKEIIDSGETPAVRSGRSASNPTAATTTTEFVEEYQSAAENSKKAVEDAWAAFREEEARLEWEGKERKTALNALDPGAAELQKLLASAEVGGLDRYRSVTSALDDLSSALRRARQLLESGRNFQEALSAAQEFHDLLQVREAGTYVAEPFVSINACLPFPS